MSNLGVSSSRLINRLGSCHAYGIPYDTSWVARNENIFPEAIKWLQNAQKPDGSWGSRFEYYHDRIISTLSALLALSKSRNSQTFNKDIELGERFISNNISKIKTEKNATIGFELIFPALLEEAEAFNLNIPNSSESYIRKIREEKLNKIDGDLVYGGNTSLSFSLEFLGSRFDSKRKHNLLKSNGSISNSPSATAFYLLHDLNKDSLSYLEEILSINDDGSALPVYPFEVFEITWAYYNFNTLGLNVNDFFVNHLQRIKNSWTKRGVGISKESVVDSDDTAMAFKMMVDMGEDPDPNVFDMWEKDEFYQCFEMERDPSISSNIHILDAIKNIKKYRGKDHAIDKILSFLERRKEKEGYWADKWHLSPYYVTSHAIIALHNLNDSLIEPAINWIMRTQKQDGSWGLNGGTMEETACSLWALLYYYDQISVIDESILINGLNYLLSKWSKKYEELWIAKGLYCPVNVVDSLVTAVYWKSAELSLFDRSSSLAQHLVFDEIPGVSTNELG